MTGTMTNARILKKTGTADIVGLARRLEAASAELRDATNEVQRNTRAVGEIMLEAAAYFNTTPIRKGKGALSPDSLSSHAAWRAWCTRHTGMTWQHCRKLVRYVLDPEAKERVAAAQRADDARRHPERVEYGSREHRIKVWVGRLLALPPDIYSEIIMRVQQAQQLRELDLRENPATMTK